MSFKASSPIQQSKSITFFEYAYRIPLFFYARMFGRFVGPFCSRGIPYQAFLGVKFGFQPQPTA